MDGGIRDLRRLADLRESLGERPRRDGQVERDDEFLLRLLDGADRVISALELKTEPWTDELIALRDRAVNRSRAASGKEPLL